MLITLRAKEPVVPSHLVLRRAVGIVALGLPFALAVPWWILRKSVESSISGYYYTDMRNIFIGSLCAIAVFMLCCRSYDRNDKAARTFSALCALGVAYFPIEPDSRTTLHQHQIGIAHYIFATLLFSTFVYFCLVSFKMTAANKNAARKQLQRNRVYTGCGYLIVASIFLICILKLFKVEQLIWGLDPTFCFESTALIAFGIAWLVKGETDMPGATEDKTPIRTQETSPIASDELQSGGNFPPSTVCGTEQA